ncbi:D-2-hydroxyacid dehydrogenase [Bacillus alkalicola]|uniref:D-2-hydroxyacid dehydrogenase n=1 Tax=Evansella alkalicola TaxID=745819 RepID=A0ABS6JVK7_9BACI|nr:D-2-hydroxyacid dehydrogenase [Bacillus alkalicola]
MKINNILIASPMYKELQLILETEDIYKEKSFRFRSMEVEKEDFLWADAFVAFSRPNNFSFDNLKWVHSLGAGVDKILRGSEWKRDIPLTRTICSFGQKISEYGLSYILRDLQHQDEFSNLARNKDWKPITPIPLSEKKVLIYGTGVIGQEVAATLTFFGTKVYGVSLSGKEKKPFIEVFASDSNYQEVLAEADVIINTMPLTEKTRDLFNESLFKLMQDVLFINVGRGESVNNDALIKAIDKGQVKRAVLDVFQEEPLPKDDPFWSHPQVVVTPHISAVTTPEEGVACFVDTLKKIEAGESLPNLVDLDKGF